MPNIEKRSEFTRGHWSADPCALLAGNDHGTYQKNKKLLCAKQNYKNNKKKYNYEKQIKTDILTLLQKGAK